MQSSDFFSVCLVIAG